MSPDNWQFQLVTTESLGAKSVSQMIVRALAGVQNIGRGLADGGENVVSVLCLSVYGMYARTVYMAHRYTADLWALKCCH